MNDEKLEKLIKEIMQENKEEDGEPLKRASQACIKRIELFLKQFDDKSPIDNLLASLLHQVIGRVGSEIVSADISSGHVAIKIAANELLQIAKQMIDTSAACEKHNANKYTKEY